MKSHNQDRRRRRRVLIERTPEDIAKAHADALWWRARLRAEATGEIVEAAAPSLPARVPAPAQRETAERARFATAIARVEFGRFYFNGERPARKRKQARNGKTTGS